MKRLTKLIREANKIAKLYHSYIPPRMDKSIVDFHVIIYEGITSTKRRRIGKECGKGGWLPKGKLK